MSTTWMDINLLPPLPVSKRYFFSLSTVSIGVLAIATITCSVLGWSTHQSNANRAQLAAQVQLQEESTSTEISALQGKLAQYQAVRQIIDRFGPMLSVDGVIQNLIHIEPNGCTLQSVNLTGNTLTVTGQASHIRDIASYQDSVNRLPFVMNCWVNSINQSTNQVIFSIEITLKGGGFS